MASLNEVKIQHDLMTTISLIQNKIKFGQNFKMTRAPLHGYGQAKSLYFLKIQFQRENVNFIR